MSEYISVWYSRDQIPVERFSKVADVVSFATGVVFRMFLPLLAIGIITWIVTRQFNPGGILVVGDVIGGIVSVVLGAASRLRNSCALLVKDLIVNTGNEMLKAKEISDIAFEDELPKHISYEELESINAEVEKYLNQSPDEDAMTKIVTLIKTYISPVVEEIARLETVRLEKAARLENERLRELNLELEARNYGVSKSFEN